MSVTNTGSSDREVRLERVREVVKIKNEVAQLKKIEEHFTRKRAVSQSAEVDDVIRSARESIRKHEGHIADLLRGSA